MAKIRMFSGAEISYYLFYAGQLCGFQMALFRRINPSQNRDLTQKPIDNV